ncbi:unnamed protein product [Lampetra fluviatilis]
MVFGGRERESNSGRRVRSGQHQHQQHHHHQQQQGRSSTAAKARREEAGSSPDLPPSGQDCAKDGSSDPTGPDYCRRILVRDAKGAIRELVLPKGLDLERPKRTRTSFTAEQLYRLECEFQRCQYLVGRERTELARQLNLSETQVKVWFQNRRTKHKKDQTKDSAEGRSPSSESAATCSVLRLLEQGRLLQPTGPPSAHGTGHGPRPGPPAFLTAPGCPGLPGGPVFPLSMPSLPIHVGLPLELAVRPLHGTSAFEPYSRNGKSDANVNHKKGHS